MFPQATTAELHRAGFQLIIFANHALRAAIRAMGDALQTLKARGTASAVADTIVPLSEVYRLVGLDQLHAREQQFIPQSAAKARAVILAAGFEQQLLPLIEDRPKAMLEIKGRTILERQVQLLRAAGIHDIAVVRGYRAEAINLPGITCYENPQFKTHGIAASLFAAAEALTGPTLILYGDILFDRTILDRLLDSPGDVNLVVDRAWSDLYRAEGRSPEGAELVITQESAAADGRRFLPSEQPAAVLKIGQRLEPAAASGEFIGLCHCSAEGIRWLKDAYQAGLACQETRPFHEAETFAKASFTDLLQTVIDQGHPVQAVEIYKGWLEVDTFEDYRRAWAKL